MESSNIPLQGPPYAPQVAQPGLLPTIDVDAPILAVLMILYLGGAVLNMTILQLNRRRGHKFLMSGAMFGFCMARLTTCSVRIAWAVHPTNIRLGIAASIFTNVGVLIVYVILLILASRMLKATHPTIGWSRAMRVFFMTLYILLFVAIVLLVAFVIETFYTLDMGLRTDAIWIERAGILYMLIFNIVTLAILLATVLLPPASNSENFGKGSIASKQLVIGVALFFILFIVGFRTGTIWSAPRPISNPAWFQEKPAFYIIEFCFEVVVIYWLGLMRFDQKFWVPDGSRQPGDYSKIMIQQSEEKEVENV